MDCRCSKCKCNDYFVRTTVFPSKEDHLKFNLSTYYLKICSECGYTEIYSAEIVDRDLKKIKGKIKLEPEPIP